MTILDPSIRVEIDRQSLSSAAAVSISFTIPSAAFDAIPAEEWRDGLQRLVKNAVAQGDITSLTYLAPVIR